jgi:hypothetical protein
MNRIRGWMIVALILMMAPMDHIDRTLGMAMFVLAMTVGDIVVAKR